MSIDFGGIPTFQYKGTPYARPMMVGEPGLYCVPLTFNWIVYGASDNFQNIAVTIDLSGTTTQQPRQLLNKIRSVYVDNSGSPVPIYVFFPDTQFTAVAQPYSTGWYPVFTNAFNVLIVGLGFVSAQIPKTRVFLTNAPVIPYTDTALQTVLPNELASLTLGGGSGINSIVPIPPGGQDYNNGGLSITGGGGTGAAAHGILDQFGRFIQVIIDSGGQNYTGLPVIMPTAAQTLPPNYSATIYNPGNHVSYNGIEYIWQGSGFSTGTIHTNAGVWNGSAGYGNGTQINYGNFIYQATTDVAPGGLPPPNNGSQWRLVGPLFPDGGAPWLSSGTAPGTTATFATTLTAVSRPIVSSGLALPSLGDQAQNVIDVIAPGAGVFRHNLWGTPFSVGFIYIKSINVKVLASATGDTQWNIFNDNGYIPFNFSCAATVNVSFEQDMLSLQGMNMKLDATLEWKIERVGGASASTTISHGWAWTYALI